MILSDGAIREKLASGHLVIDGMSDPDEQIQPSSVDLRLGDRVSVFRRHDGDMGEHTMFDPQTDDASLLMKEYRLSDTLSLDLPPRAFLLAHTAERVALPHDLVGVVDGRSSMGRLGVMVHITAGYIDPGFQGQITLEMHNVGPLTVRLRPGDRVCQIRFHRMTRPAERPYAGKYQGDEGAVGSRLNRDFQK